MKPSFPAAAKQHTDAGAVAFVEYYLEVVNYAWTKPDSSVLDELADAECVNCRGLQHTAEELVAQQHKYGSRPIAVEGLSHAFTYKGEVRVHGFISQLATQRVTRSGQHVKDIPASKLERLFDVVWTGSWKMLNIGSS